LAASTDADCSDAADQVAWCRSMYNRRDSYFV
jgi:hypothetical protein